MPVVQDVFQNNLDTHDSLSLERVELLYDLFVSLVDHCFHLSDLC
jgi:hypothetical protein